MKEGSKRQITKRLPVKANVSIVRTDPWHERAQKVVFEPRRQWDDKNSRLYHVQLLLKAHIVSLMTQTGVSGIYSVKGFSQALWSYIALRGIKQTVA